MECITTGSGGRSRYIFPKLMGCGCVRIDAAVFLRNKKPFERNRANGFRFRDQEMRGLLYPVMPNLVMMNQKRSHGYIFLLFANLQLGHSYPQKDREPL